MYEPLLWSPVEVLAPPGPGLMPRVGIHIVFVDAENHVAEIKHIALIEMLPEIPDIHLETVI
jgi:hypothetical protein